MADFHIPDHLPYDLELPERSVVPLFALPNVCLFPGTVVPLHIFEPRYKQMIEDLLDGPGRFVVGTVRAGHEPELKGTPPVHAIGGLGEIGRHEKLEDGRFLILVLGLKRVHLEEVPSDRLYRKVEVHPLEEVAPDREEETALRAQLVEVLQRELKPELKTQPSGKDLPLERLPLTQLTDLLILHLRLDQERLLGLFSEPSVSARAEAALSAHAIQQAAGDETEPGTDDGDWDAGEDTLPEDLPEA